MTTSAQQPPTASAPFSNVDSLHSRHYLDRVQDYYATSSSGLSESLSISESREKSSSSTVPPAPPSSPVQNKHMVQLPSISSLCLRGVAQKEQPHRPDTESDSFILFSPFPSSHILPLYPASIQPDFQQPKRSSSSLLRETLTHRLAENVETHRAAYDELVAMKRRQTLPNMAYQDLLGSKGRSFSPIDFNFRRRALSAVSTVSPTNHLKVNFKPLRCKSPNSLDAINGLLTLSGAKKVSNNTITNVSVYDLLQSRSSQSPADKAFRDSNTAGVTMTLGTSLSKFSLTGSSAQDTGHLVSSVCSSSSSSVCDSLISEYASLAKKKRRVHMCSHRDCYKIFPSLSRLERHERVHEEKKVFRCESPACTRKFSSEDKLILHMKEHLHV